jgi:uncharacterized protein
MKESRYNVWVEQDDAAYVYNGLSGALLRVPQTEYVDLRRFLEEDETSPCSTGLLARLAFGMMLFQDDEDELELLAARYRNSRYSTSHFALTLVTSLGCNFDCPYCYEAKHPSIMDKEVEAAVLRVLDDQLPRIASFHALWFGGEPLVGKKPLLSLSDAFIDRCNRANVAYSAGIVTNGYLLDEEMCVALRDHQVTSTQVTIDGPPDIHDRMRPLASGKGSFWRIMDNLNHAVDYLQVTIRVNLDTRNFDRTEELFQIMVDRGLAGKLSVYPAQIVGVDSGVASPSATYSGCCFKNKEFAEAELRFNRMAVKYGFSRHSLPEPVGAPCTAVRANELVVGSKGELYKCWESVGNKLEVIGDIRDYADPAGRMQKWLKYDPFTNDECRSCIALPVCMGGCAAHAMIPEQYENRCGTFRYTYEEQVRTYINSVSSTEHLAPRSVGMKTPRMETR